MRLERAIELVQHDSRLDHATAPRGVDLDDPVEISRAVENDRSVDGLAGLRRATAPGRHCNAFRTANRERAFGVGHCARGDHAERHGLIMRGVGGITAARKCVETDIARLLRLEPSFERFFQRWQ
jgi:hypothetical protein